MRYLTFEHAVALHDAVESPGIRDAGAVVAAVGRPQATAFGQDAYPTDWEKAAAQLHSLARSHPFVDGNKRTAWVAPATFLTLNGHPLDPEFSTDESFAFMIAVAEGNYADVAAIASELVKFFD